MKRTKKLLALLLALAMVIALFPTVAFAEGDIGREKLNVEDHPPVTGYIHVDLPGGRAVTNAYLERQARGADDTNDTRDTLPSAYDSRDYGYITPVRNQNPYGTCWSFGTIAPIEAYMIKHGIVNKATGQPATTAIDLSEYHLAWFTYTNAYDKLGLLAGDYTSATSANYLNTGGTGYMACYTVMRWEGPGSESTSALAYSNASANGLNSAYAYNYDVAHVTDSIWIPVANRDAVKRAIMEYGAATIVYYHSDSYLNSRTAGFCYKANGTVYGNHAVTVVGWNDNYSRSNFNSSYGPSGNGAWIIKNSWGSSWGDRGYFYLSYEDTASLNETCFFYKVAPADNYSNCYQYDGTSNAFSYVSLGNNCQVANIYTAAASENLTAVAINLFDEATSYTVSIYKNPGSTPTSGTLMSSQTGYIDFAGYYTIPLKTPVPLSSGDKFAVVFTLNTPYYSDGGYVHIPYDASYTISWAKFVHANHGNTSYYKNANGNWTDVPNNGDFRIKAYTGGTSAPSYTVTARSNNTSWGTVSVDGNVITAKPANGYYVSDVRVSSGTATFKTEGNTITVTPSSNCTIDVIFAAKPTYYIQYVACGENQGTASAKVGDSVTLPTSVSKTPAGWTFIGWMNQQIDQTTSKPTYYAAGTSYTVTGNETLYAVYSRTEGDSTIVYERLTAAPSDWTGDYVITYGYNTSLTALKMLSSAQQIENSDCGASVSFAYTGMSLNNGVLYNVPDCYVFHVGKNGSYYYLQGCNNKYLGSQDGYLHILNSYQSSYADWTMEYDSSNACMKVANVASSSYPYLVVGSNGYFVVNSIYTTYKTYFWKQSTSGTIYYWTDPIPAEHRHEMKVFEGVEPTCTTEGRIAYYHCTVCDKLFTDAEGEREISYEDTVIPATGHTTGKEMLENETEPTCTQKGGYDTVVYCLSCGVELSRVHTNIPATGHTPGKEMIENETEPTCTVNGGYDTVTYCDVCGEQVSKVHTNIPATGHTPGKSMIENETEPTCGRNGGYDTVIYCDVCGGEVSRVHTTLPATGAHTYGEFSSNRNGTHSRTCAVCGTRDTIDCSYTDVVTEPTATDYGYTTHTCTVCAYSFKDSYTTPLGFDYAVHFSVPKGVEEPADMISNTNTGITLPVIEAPEGYNFLGWVTADFENVTEKPEVLTGKYTAQSEITLIALFSNVVGGSGADDEFELVTSDFADWTGRYMITYLKNSEMVLMTGIPAGCYEDGGDSITKLSKTSMNLSGNKISGASDAYVYEVEAVNGGYSIKSASKDTFVMLDSNNRLMAGDDFANGCTWGFSLKSDGSIKIANNLTTAYPYIGFYERFWSIANTENIYLWKGTDAGTTYYTTALVEVEIPEDPTPKYTVTYSVPEGVASIPSIVAKEGTSIYLPTAGALSGDTFIGWVTEDVNSASRPANVLTGSYVVNGNVTLKALYSYSSYAGSCYERVNSTLADWSGKYVITYGTDTSDPYVLKGLSGNTSYQNTSCGGTVKLANAGMKVVDGKLTGVTNSYVFTIAPKGSYYTILNNGTNTYLGSYSRSLYSRTNYSLLYCRWSISCSNGNALLKSTIYPLYPYLTFSSNNYFMMSSNRVNGINLWKETASYKTYYSTK